MYKTKVLDYWCGILTSRVAVLSSLRFLKSDFMSLTQPHPIWSSLPGHNPYEVQAARVQALLLVGKYRNEKSVRFWSGNSSGFCRLPSCLGSEIIESRTHFLLQCATFYEKRRRLMHISSLLLADMPLLTPIIHEYLYEGDLDTQVQFLIDCSVMPLVISACQQFGEIIHKSLFKFTRTWCWSLHRARKRILDSWWIYSFMNFRHS